MHGMISRTAVLQNWLQSMLVINSFFNILHMLTCHAEGHSAANDALRRACVCKGSWPHNTTTTTVGIHACALFMIDRHIICM